MDSPLSLESVVVVSPDQVSCDLGQESSILGLKNNVYYGLNALGSRVWKLLHESRSVSELRKTLLEEYDVDEQRCERDLLELLEKLHAEGLIAIVESKQT